MNKLYITATIMLSGLPGCAWKGQEIKQLPETKKEQMQSGATPSVTTEGSDRSQNPDPKPAISGSNSDPVKSEPQKIELEKPVPKKPEPIRQIDVSIQWATPNTESNNHKLSRTISIKNDVSEEFYLDHPVTLPATVPEWVELDFNVGGLNIKPDEEILATGKADSSDLSLKNIGLAVMPDHSIIETTGSEAHLKAKIYGLRNFLSDHDQQKAFITLDFRYAKTNRRVAFVYLALATPPRNISFEQADPTKTIEIHNLNTMDFDVLQSPSKKLELIQVIKARNGSSEEVVVEHPAQVTGKLWQKRRWYDPQHRILNSVFIDKELCLGTVEIKNRDFVFSEKFYVLPIKPDLKDSWITILSENSGNLTIPPGKEKLFGLFAENLKSGTSLRNSLNESRLIEYYDHNYRWKPELKTIPTKCEFGCINAQNYPRFFTQCADISDDHPDWKSQCQERVTACTPCVELRSLTAFEPIWNPICNQCHTLEIQEGINQIFDYHGMKACLSWGTKVLETKQEPWGEIPEPVALDLNTEELKAFVRFNYSTKESDPEGRLINFLKPSTALE